ncbi:hypothetical protein [Pseudonocardia sp.]|uniref:hypothetical protein n=1 Tax=Pseudonocardia sp. TaxID=60912 RepID=UPI002DB4314C|nr:hypothetical protein [Pseudonocardia sp.]
MSASPNRIIRLPEFVLISRIEGAYIRELQSNDPAVAYNRRPKHQGPDRMSGPG